MKPEIIMMLNMGLTPIEVAKFLSIDVHMVYYYNRQLDQAKFRLKKLLIK